MNLDTRITQAVKRYWVTRQSQKKKQGSNTGVQDYGSRSDVTGGKQMDGFAELICELLHESGLDKAQMFSGRRASELPGYYRPEKNWDWVVVADGRLLALLELKSQVGPSFGNNFNNRVEEALGNATDLWKAYSEGTFAPSQQPWAGYLMLLEDCKESQNGSVFTSRTSQFAMSFKTQNTSRSRTLSACRTLNAMRSSAENLLLRDFTLLAAS